MTMLLPVDKTLTSPPAVAAPSNEMVPGEVAVSRPEAVSVADVVIVLLLSVILEPVTEESKESVFFASRSMALPATPRAALTTSVSAVTETALLIAELSVMFSTPVV